MWSSCLSLVSYLFSAFQMQRYLCPAAGCFGVHRQYAACSWSISLFPQEEHLKTSLRELTRDTDTNVKPNGSKVKDYGKLDVISSDSNWSVDVLIQYRLCSQTSRQHSLASVELDAQRLGTAAGLKAQENLDKYNRLHNSFAGSPMLIAPQPA